MSILPTWPIIVAGSAFAFAAGVFADHTVMAGRIAKINAAHADVLRQMAEIQATDQAEARTKERAWTERVGQIEQEKTDENARIAARYAAQLDSLRQRPDRRPTPANGVPEATAACAAATGAELSRPDAEFLIGESARADRQRAALAACYGAYDALR